MYASAVISIYSKQKAGPNPQNPKGDYSLKRSAYTSISKATDATIEDKKVSTKISNLLPPTLQSKIWILLSGIPNTTHVGWSVLSLIINMLLTIMTLDFIYRTPLFYQSQDLSFARVGYVSGQSAKLLVREPRRDRLPVSVSYRILGTGINKSGPESWKIVDRVDQLTEATDFTHTFTIRNLISSTQYQYASSSNHTGSFVTAPEPGRSKLTFLTSSCIKPRVPYNPFAHPLDFRGLRHVADVLPRLKASFMLFLGDFIYIDVPRRFGYSAESYRREYRQVYASPDWPAASTSLPWLHVLDDHEIANDWDRGMAAPYPNATDPWQNYHVLPNPPAVRPNSTYFSFTHGPASFFMMDTRRHRSSSEALPSDHPDKTMLGKAQLTDLLIFLSRKEPSGVYFKIVVSSIPFTRNWRLNAADTWSGYLHERQIILEAMWDVSLSSASVGAVVLSGDRHEFAATAFPPPKHGRWPLSGTVYEFSTSPLNMFYLPFRTYREKKGEDEVCIKYVPDGNSKFGAIEIEGVPNGGQGNLKFRLFVEGVETWNYVITTPLAVAGNERRKNGSWG